MTSETKIAYGSRVFRQGRSRPNAWNQARSSSSITASLAARTAILLAPGERSNGRSTEHLHFRIQPHPADARESTRGGVPPLAARARRWRADDRLRDPARAQGDAGTGRPLPHDRAARLLVCGE